MIEKPASKVNRDNMSSTMSYDHHSSPQNKHEGFLTSLEFQRLLLFAQMQHVYYCWRQCGNI